METLNNNNAGWLFVLDGENKKILAFNTQTGEFYAVLENVGDTPDGIAIDVKNKHIYWTNMGEHYDRNDGYIERVDFDGNNRTVIIPPGETFTPKQIKIDVINGHLYWCDREGMRVMRSDLNGKNIVTLIETGYTREDREDETKHCVGIAIDIENAHLYWTQKGPPKAGLGRIFRAGLALPYGTDPLNRNDIEMLWFLLPEPIDLELDLDSGYLYWTDRGAPPRGNTLNRASIIEGSSKEVEILSEGLDEAIGLSLDLENQRVFFGDLGGNLYCRKFDSPERCILYSGKGRFTGMAYIPEHLMS